MIKIIELPEDDVNRILALVQREAVSGKIYNTYWAEVADRIMMCLKAQENGVFFQCAACTDYRHDKTR